jgi:prepilin-type N-terminal cleavage/methylation domain-containing protein
MWLNKKGFTLLELMIVVIVIGILAAIAMPRYIDTIERARMAEALSNLDVIRASEKRYWAEQLGWSGTGTYTNSIDALDIDNPNNEPNRLFTYSITGAGAAGFTATAVRVGDATRYVSINQDGTIVRTGY